MMQNRKNMKRAGAAVLSASLCMSMGMGILPAQAHAAGKKSTYVKITAPKKVNSGKTGTYTITQVKGKKKTIRFRAVAKYKGRKAKVYYKSSNTKILKINKTSGKAVTGGTRSGKAVVTAYLAKQKKVKARIKVQVKTKTPAKKPSKGNQPADKPSAGNKPAGSSDTVKKPKSHEVIDYSDGYFNYQKSIKAQKNALSLVPKAAAIEVQAADEKGVTGVEIIGSADQSNQTDYYLNAYVAGNVLKLTPDEGKKISRVESIKGEKTTEEKTADVTEAVKKGSFVPDTLDAGKPADQILKVTMEDGAVYRIHTMPETMPELSVVKQAVAEKNAGVYTFAVDHYLLRVNTKGELIYYRNLLCAGEHQVENFAPQQQGKNFSYFAELNTKFRNANGGFSSGMYVVMDENYREIDQVTLHANAERNHTHGEGYLDQHEFVMLGKGHYLTLSYTKMLVNNLPDTVKGLEGTKKAYVWAGIIQEVRDGKVVRELNTTDYPLLYESAVEKMDYAGSTAEGTEVAVGQDTISSYADGWQDYVHVNSVDYTLHPDGSIDKLLVSMRDQSAVYQFDAKSGKIDWILGGKASTLKGYDAYTRTRADDNGKTFQALTFGQHYARYSNKKADGRISGNPVISVFDNETGTAPFLAVKSEIPTLTRVFRAEIQEKTKTVQISDVINGTDLNKKTEKYHIASHCGSVDYFNANSVVIGWGLHGVIDTIGAYVPEGTISDVNYKDLRQGSRPIFTEYDKANDQVTFELAARRSSKVKLSEAMFSYRTYKTAK